MRGKQLDRPTKYRHFLFSGWAVFLSTTHRTSFVERALQPPVLAFSISGRKKCCRWEFSDVALGIGSLHVPPALRKLIPNRVPFKKNREREDRQPDNNTSYGRFYFPLLVHRTSLFRLGSWSFSFPSFLLDLNYLLRYKIPRRDAENPLRKVSESGDSRGLSAFLNHTRRFGCLSTKQIAAITYLKKCAVFYGFRIRHTVPPPLRPLAEYAFMDCNNFCGHADYAENKKLYSACTTQRLNLCMLWQVYARLVSQECTNLPVVRMAWMRKQVYFVTFHANNTFAPHRYMLFLALRWENSPNLFDSLELANCH